MFMMTTVSSLGTPIDLFENLNKIKKFFSSPKKILSQKQFSKAQITVAWNVKILDEIWRTVFVCLSWQLETRVIPSKLNKYSPLSAHCGIDFQRN